MVLWNQNKFLRIGLLLLILIIFSSNAIAENCDYYQFENYTEEETRFYLGDTLLSGVLEIEDTTISGEKVSFKIYNPFSFEIEVRVSYVMKSSWFGDRPNAATGVIPAEEYKVLTGTYYSDARTSLGDVTFNVNQPEGLTSRLERVSKQNEICMNCGSNQIFCESSGVCLDKKSVPLDVEPVCGLRETCLLEYINPETGLCAKSPSQLEAERLSEEAKIQREKDEANRLKAEQEEIQLQKEEQERIDKQKFVLSLLIGIILIVVIVGIVIYILKHKTAKDKQKIIQKEIELEAKKIESIEYESFVLDEKMAEIRKKKKRTQQENKKLDDLKSNQNKLLGDIKNRYKRITKPFFDDQVLRKVIIVPEVKGDYTTWQGYKCFYDENKKINEYTYTDLVHRWVWKKHNGRWPKKGYHIHHVDHDKLNNYIKNLEEIPGSEHRDKHKYH